MILPSKRSCPHLPGKTHDFKSWNSFLHRWLCAVCVQASTCNLYRRLSEIHWTLFCESGLIDMVPKDTVVSMWSDSLGCSSSQAHSTRLLYQPQELQLIFSLLHQGIKVDVARSADSPDKKKTCFLFLWLQQPLRKIEISLQQLTAYSF